MTESNNDSRPPETSVPPETPGGDCVRCLVRDDVFGWYDDETQTVPVHDPYPHGLCAVCSKTIGTHHPTDNPLKTISLCIQEKRFRNRSYFFRAHKACWEACEDQNAIESSLIDSIHGKDHIGEVNKMASQIPPECRVCGGGMNVGLAIPPAHVPMDHGQISEGVWDGVAPLVDVWKCDSCGHSFSVPNAESRHAEKDARI